MMSLAPGLLREVRFAHETREAYRAAAGTRSGQHVGLSARAHMGPRAFQIHSVVTILAVHATVSSKTRDVHAPAS